MPIASLPGLVVAHLPAEPLSALGSDVVGPALVALARFGLERVAPPLLKALRAAKSPRVTHVPSKEGAPAENTLSFPVLLRGPGSDDGLSALGDGFRADHAPLHVVAHMLSARE
jgi:hypothetical protein